MAQEPKQPVFAFAKPEVLAQGNGDYLVRTGAATTRLTPDQFGRAVGLSRASIYRHIAEGNIPQSFIERAGPRLIYIQAAALDHFRRKWNNGDC